jgi:hypothetical protein
VSKSRQGFCNARHAAQLPQRSALSHSNTDATAVTVPRRTAGPADQAAYHMGRGARRTSHDVSAKVLTVSAPLQRARHKQGLSTYNMHHPQDPPGNALYTTTAGMQELPLATLLLFDMLHHHVMIKALNMFILHHDCAHQRSASIPATWIGLVTTSSLDVFYLLVAATGTGATSRGKLRMCSKSAFVAIGAAIGDDGAAGSACVSATCAPLVTLLRDHQRGATPVGRRALPPSPLLPCAADSAATLALLPSEMTVPVPLELR